MSITIQQLKEHLIGLGHGGSLNKVRNFEALCERAQNTFLSKCSPVSTIRTVAISQVIHDDIYNYGLPSDFKREIDLYPQDQRYLGDNAPRELAKRFDLKKLIQNKTVSIEASEGTKIIRINWRSRSPRVISQMDSLTQNGTWSAVTGAGTPTVDTVFKVAGSGSLKFDLNTTGGGLQSSSLTSSDLSTGGSQNDFFLRLYFPTVTNLTSVTGIWGNDLTTNFYTSVAQTAQADGTAFRVGWNLIKFPGLTATQTGSVSFTTIDSFKFTLQTTGAIASVRADYITASLGRNFDIKYYSKYIFKTSAGVYESRPQTDNNDDIVVLDNDEVQGFILECLIAMAQQVEGTDSAFDITFAEHGLYGNPSSATHEGRMGFYRLYNGENPVQSKRAVNSRGGLPRFRR